MRDHTGCKRKFSISHKQYYASKCSDMCIYIGMYDDDGSTSGEFKIIWEYLGKGLVPKLIAWDDSWSALFHFQDLLQEMEKIDDQNISESEFVEILNRLKIEDKTQYNIP